MSTTITIGYGDGEPLKAGTEVDLLADGKLVATARAVAGGLLVFAADPPPTSALAVRLHRAEQG